LLLFRLDTPLFFANATLMRDRLRGLGASADPPYGVVPLDLEANSDLDLESADTLAELHEELYHVGTGLRLARGRAPVREMLDRTGLTRRVGEGKMFPSVRAGVAAYRDRGS
jgi:SulP family sulfate permease